MNTDHFPDRKHYPFSIAQEIAIFCVIRHGTDPKAATIEQDAAREAADQILHHLYPLIQGIAERYYQRLAQQWRGVPPEIKEYFFDVGRQAVRNEITRYYPDTGKTFKFPGVANHSAKNAISQACEALKRQWSRKTA